MKKWFSLLFSIAFLALASGCGGGAPAPTEPPPTSPPEPAAEPTEEPAGGYQEVEVTNGATIKGVVIFAGEVPEPEVLAVTKDQDVCGQEKGSRTLLVSADGGIQNAVVSIPGITQGKPLSALAAGTKLDQVDCHYEPHVIIAPVGASVTVANSDPLMHNVHTFTFDNPPLNKAQPKDSAPLTTSLEFPEEIEVGCDVHDWMKAWIVVASNPYYTKTGEAGVFELTDMPAGTYELKVWHETLGVQTQMVTVEAGDTVEVTFELSP